VREIPGVLATEVGYTGGDTPAATYEQVKTGRTGHAESLKIVFDPKQLTYRHLLFEYFRMHNPTTRNQQGNDIARNTARRFFMSEKEQKRTAEEVIKTVDASGRLEGQGRHRSRAVQGVLPRRGIPPEVIWSRIARLYLSLHQADEPWGVAFRASRRPPPRLRSAAPAPGSARPACGSCPVFLPASFQRCLATCKLNGT